MELLLREEQRKRGKGGWAPGVFLPEQLASGHKAARQRLIKRLTSTEGTFTYRLEQTA